MNEPIRYRDIPQVASFFRDYVSGSPQALELLPGGFSELDDHLQATRALASRTYPRAELAATLLEGNRRLGADERALDSVARLEREDTFAIVAGQQTGIYGGPLFTIYKALSAIAIARRLEDQSRGEFHFVPLFWSASEDHDIDEIDHLYLHANDGPRREKAPIERSGAAARDVLIDDAFLEFQEELRRRMPASDFRDDVFARIGARRGESLADWFSRSLLTLLGDTGLAIVDPDWIRELSRPVFEKAVRDHEEIESRLESSQKRVVNAGYSPIIDRSGALHLFRTINGSRTRLRIEDDRVVASTGESSTREDLIARILAHPDEFSADVVTRPLVQSHVLPVPTFVGGPSEIAYFAELRDIFAAFELPMPRLFPRVSLTLVSPRQANALRSFGLAPSALFGMPETPPVDPDLPDSVRAPLEHLRAALANDIPLLAEASASLDPALRRTVEKLGDQIGQRFDRLERAVRNGADRVAGRGRDKWMRLRGELLPRGRLQERVYGALPYLVRYGDAFLTTLSAEIDVFDFRHQIVTLEPAAKREVIP